MTRLYIDRNTNLPVRVEQYGFPKKPGQERPLIEEYTWTELPEDALTRTNSRIAEETTFVTLTPHFQSDGAARRELPRDLAIHG